MTKTRKKLFATLAALSTATVFQATPGSCTDFLVYQGLTSLDFCAVFNCTGGTFFNFCSPIVLFVDCL